jgi:hypothetical protein
VQSVRPAAHPATHCPALQTWFEPQAVPQAPQFFASEVTSTHVPLQSVVPASQTQAWLLQIFPPEQAVPQAPQFCALLPRSTQPPEHSVSGAVQLAAHWPSSHTMEPVQAWPQLPQLDLSVAVFVHVPLHVVSPVPQVTPPSGVLTDESDAASVPGLASVVAPPPLPPAAVLPPLAPPTPLPAAPPEAPPVPVLAASGPPSAFTDGLVLAASSELHLSWAANTRNERARTTRCRFMSDLHGRARRNETRALGSGLLLWGKGSRILW